MARYSDDPLKIELYTHPLCGSECNRIGNLIQKDVLSRFWNAYYVEIPFDAENFNYWPDGNPYSFQYYPSIAILKGSKVQVIDGANRITAKEIRDILVKDFDMVERNTSSPNISETIDVAGGAKKNWWLFAGIAVLAVLAIWYVTKK